LETYLLDWANLLLRWLHVIVAIAWIGSSFYFVFLDSNLEPPKADDLKKKGVDGAIWSVHGGGFYNAHKYMVAPQGGIDSKLHWFFWESYWTWISGFSLFVVLYLWNASIFLVDKNVFDWSPVAAGFGAVGFLVGFWLIYDTICRVFGFRANGERIVGALILVVVALAAWLACQLFAGRAAFLIVGAMIATTMSANVFFWIIPGQRKVVAAMTSGQPYDPADYAIYGKRGKQRSVHNTYFTLPVLVAMLSNHYAWLYQARHAWLVLVALMLAGALIRHSFVARHAALREGRRVPWEYAGAGVAVLLGLAVALAPAPAAPSAAAAAPPAFADVRAVFERRCVLCHNAALANKGIMFQTPELIGRNAQAAYQQAAVQKTMPLNNATQITDDERALIRRWFESGAPTN